MTKLQPKIKLNKTEHILKNKEEANKTLITLSSLQKYVLKENKKKRVVVI